MARIAIIGAGNVGANTAFFVAEENIGDVTLYDLQDGLAHGKALDLMEAAPLRGFHYALAGGDSDNELRQSEIIILAAGAVRTPGMKRAALAGANQKVVDTVADRLAGYGGVVLVATEPVDAMTARFVERSGLPRQRVVGLGGALDSLWFRAILSRLTGISAEDITTMVVGRHADEMLLLPAYTRINGVPAERVVDPADLAAAVQETREAGDTIVELAQRSSSYYAPAAVAAEVCRAVIGDTRRILALSFVWDGHYGIKDVAMSLPVVVGREGIVRVVAPRLADQQIQQLNNSAAALRAIAVAARGE